MILRILCANNTGRDSFLKVQFILRTSRDCQILYFTYYIVYIKEWKTLSVLLFYFQAADIIFISSHIPIWFLNFEFKHYILCKIAIWIKLLLIFWLFWYHENVPHLSITWPTSEKTFYFRNYINKCSYKRSLV